MPILLVHVLSKPRGKRIADFSAASRLLEAHPNAFVLDDDEGGRSIDVAPPGKVGTGVVIDAVELEGVVISPTLQHLGEESFYPARLP